MGKFTIVGKAEGFEYKDGYTVDHVNHFLLEARRSIHYRKSLSLLQFNLSDMMDDKSQVTKTDLMELYAVVSDALEEAREIE